MNHNDSDEDSDSDCFVYEAGGADINPYDHPLKRNISNEDTSSGDVKNGHDDKNGMYILDVLTTMTAAELKNVLMDEKKCPWIPILRDNSGAKRKSSRGRPGVHFISSSMPGITTPLFAVVEKIRGKKTEVVVCETEHDAERQRRNILHDRLERDPKKDYNEEKKKLKVICTWMNTATHKRMKQIHPDRSNELNKYMLAALKEFSRKKDGNEGFEDSHTVKSEYRKATKNKKNLEKSLKEDDKDAKNKDRKEILERVSCDIPYRPDQRDLLYRVTSSLYDLAGAVEQAHAYVVSDLVASNNVINALTRIPNDKDENVPNEKIYRDSFKSWMDNSAQEPLVLFHGLVRSRVPLILHTQKRMIDVIRANRSSFPNRTLVLVVHEDSVDPDAPAYIPGMKFGPKLVKAIADALAKEKSDKSNSAGKSNRAGKSNGAGESNSAVKPKGSEERADCVPQECLQAPTLSVVCSPASWALAQMAECASRNLPLLVLEGSGRYAEIWSELWPTRASTVFNPVAVRARLASYSGYELGPADVGSVRTVLRDGDLTIHKISDGALPNLVLWHLTGDKLIDEACETFELYEDTYKSYARWRNFLLLLTITLGLAATVMALYLSQDEGSPQHVILIVFPALIGIVDSTENYSNSTAAAAATKRAAGLVKKEMYLYHTRTLHYSDSSVAVDSTSASHFNTRQRLFKEALVTIDAAVETTGAICRRTRTPPKERNAPFHGKLSGYEYIQKRVTKKLSATRDSERNYFTLGLFTATLKYITLAFGSVCAALEETRLVAISVAVTVAISRIITAFRIEEYRKAYGKAATKLEERSVWWKSLCSEEASQQKNIDELVSSVEQALEDTLPGVSGGSHK